MDITGLLNIEFGREKRHEEILEHWEKLDLEQLESDEEENVGPVIKTIQQEPNSAAAWIRLTNFTQEEVMDLIREME